MGLIETQNQCGLDRNTELSDMESDRAMLGLSCGFCKGTNSRRNPSKLESLNDLCSISPFNDSLGADSVISTGTKRPRTEAEALEKEKRFCKRRAQRRSTCISGVARLQTF